MRVNVSMRLQAVAGMYLQQGVPYADCVFRSLPISEYNTYRFVHGANRCRGL